MLQYGSPAGLSVQSVRVRVSGVMTLALRHALGEEAFGAGSRDDLKCIEARSWGSWTLLAGIPAGTLSKTLTGQ